MSAGPEIERLIQLLSKLPGWGRALQGALRCRFCKSAIS